jgi:S1-C subfamily serine protease
MLLACTFGYQEDGDLTTISIEQTKSTHHYNYDSPIKSSLKIVSMNSDLEKNGHGSGNYFKIGKQKFILTAAHLIGDTDTLWAEDTKQYVFLFPVYVDEENDIAILVPSLDLEGPKAVNYRINKKENLTGLSVIYAGFPADSDLSLFSGMVSSCSEMFCTMQAFALPGASGSVIFDNSGKIIGLVSAVKMGFNGMSPFPEMYPSLVYLARTNKLKRDEIKELLIKWKSLK